MNLTASGKIGLISSTIIMFMALAAPLLAVEEAALWKDVTFKIEGDYQAYGKYFSERDINKYDGNQAGQTDKVEAWLEHELRLMPAIVFKPDALELHARIDVGPYLFQSDHNDRIYIKTDHENTASPEAKAAGLDSESKRDSEKPRVEDLYLQMITPVGLIVAGRFAGGSEGLVWGIQLPQAPGWTFALAWNKKNEEKWDYEDSDIYYTSPLVQNYDYLDRDDQDEFKAITWYETKDKSFKSEQWVDCRWGASHSGAKNMRIFIPQWRLIYNKEKLHWMHVIGSGFGNLADLPDMQQGQDMQALIENGVLLNSLNPLYNFPVVEVKKLYPVGGKTWVLAGLFSYDIGKLSPEAAGFYMAGGTHYNEIDGFGWDEYEPQGYRTPRKFKTLLIGEIEDKYYPTMANLATYSAFRPSDICFHNMSALKFGATYHATDKWELFGQIMGAWRTNTKYYQQEYWDMFPIMFALLNQRTNATTGHQEVPFVFKRNDTVYYQDNISNYLGTELDTRVTYHLYDGLDISLLGGYFRTGDFYKDILTPKPYKVQWVDTTTMAPVGSATDMSGPYLGSDRFELSDFWSIQLKVDFKFKTM